MMGKESHAGKGDDVARSDEPDDSLSKSCEFGYIGHKTQEGQRAKATVLKFGKAGAESEHCNHGIGRCSADSRTPEQQ
ncbi:hypothetical protein TIFTF001_014083 [Ficus carica]|uniref:Uncharacterized protein n=1 Tax=Ficus carica TaxID=3494 RepID=A0AA88D3P6_FICCA|nr:hypothetical protein TIFTF001_014083 [Ficus carica]